MSSSGITEFLSELAESEALSVLREAYSRQAILVFKLENMTQPCLARINSFVDKRVMLSTEPIDAILPTDKEVSMKFNIGTEVYFVKTHFKAHMNRFYFDMGTKVIQLKRRKEPRFVIPKNWNQSGCIVISANSHEQIRCNVIDISKSGIRFELTDETHQVYRRDDIIHIRFQIHKRAEVSTMAIVRFALYRPQNTSLLGLEFANISDLQSERVASIVGDLQLNQNAFKA